MIVEQFIVKGCSIKLQPQFRISASPSKLTHFLEKLPLLRTFCRHVSYFPGTCPVLSFDLINVASIAE